MAREQEETIVESQAEPPPDEEPDSEERQSLLLPAERRLLRERREAKAAASVPSETGQKELPEEHGPTEPEEGQASDVASSAPRSDGQHRGIASNMKRWCASHPESEWSQRYRAAVTEHKRSTISSMIAEWPKQPGCTSRVTKSQSISESTRKEKGGVAKSWFEMMHMFGEQGARERAKVYQSFEDSMLASTGVDMSKPENRWYIVPELRESHVVTAERKLQRTDSNTHGSEAARTIEVEALRECVGESEARALEEEPAETTRPKAAGRAAKKSKPAPDSKQEAAKKRLRAALAKNTSLGKRLFDLKQKLKSKGRTAFEPIIASMEEELSKQGDLTMRGRHASAGEDEVTALEEQNEALTELLALGK